MLIFNKNNLISFVFKGGRNKRLLQENLKFPSEFFYGYLELNKQGYNINKFEEEELGLRIENIYLEKLLIIISKIFFNLPLNMLFGLIINQGYKKFSNSKTIIATTNSIGICFALAKKIGILKCKIIFINMGLFSKKPNIVKTLVYKLILDNVKLVCLSKYEKYFLSKLFKNKDIEYIPFGVDKYFWQKNINLKNDKYVLSIGSDLSRDWDLLINSWRNDFPVLKIVTSKPLKTFKKNIEIISGNWHNQKISDQGVRDLFSNALFVIIPLKETIQPSGQSSCLQAMACSKAVIISNISGIWDRDLIKHQKNVFFINNSDKNQLQNAVRILSEDNYLRIKLEKNGRDLVENKFNNDYMVEKLKLLIEV